MAKTDRFEHAQDGTCVVPPPILYIHVTEGLPLDEPVHSVRESLERDVPQLSQLPQWDPTLFLSGAMTNPAFAKPAAFLLYLHERNPNKRLFNPEQTSLGRRYPLRAYALFLLVLLAASLLLSRGELSESLGAEISRNACWFWFTIAVEAFVVPQAFYGVAIRIPAVPRLTASLLATALVFWFFPLRQPESSAVAMLLLFLAAPLLLVGYQLGGGILDHPLVHYLRALSAPPETIKFVCDQKLRELQLRNRKLRELKLRKSVHEMWERIRRSAD